MILIQTNQTSPAAVGFPRIGKKWFLLALSLPFVAGWVILLFLDNYDDTMMMMIGWSSSLWTTFYDDDDA